MKKIILLFGVILLSQFSFAQSGGNFYTWMDSIYAQPFMQVPDSEKTGFQKSLERLNLLYGPRLHPHGDISVAANAIINLATTGTIPNIIPLPTCGTVPTIWKERGPFDQAGYPGGGNGQINRITYDPQFNLTVNGTLNQTVYAGSFHSGLWKSTNNGESWENKTDKSLVQTSVAGIAVSHQNSEHLYIVTGQGDDVDLRHPLYNGTTSGVPTSIYTSGVYYSDNGGDTWTGVDISGFCGYFTNGGSCRNIIIDPTNEDIVYVPTSSGILKSTNATSGSNAPWTKLSVPSGMGENFSSLRLHPTFSNIVYAASSNTDPLVTDEIIKSTDGGLTWTKMTGTGTNQLDIRNLPNGFSLDRMKVEVTPAAPDKLYAYLIGKIANPPNSDYRERYIYVYENGTWTDPPLVHDGGKTSITSYMGIAISPLDENIIVYGSIKFHNFFRPSNNPNHIYDYTAISGHPHDDVHDIVFEPNSTSLADFMVAHHGGISQSHTRTDRPINYKFLQSRSKGINSSMLWGLDVSKIDPNQIIMGRQDNGAHESMDGFLNWTRIPLDGDGYAVAYANEQKVLPMPIKQTRFYDINSSFDTQLPTLAPHFRNQMVTSQNKAYYPHNARNKNHPNLNTTLVGMDDLWSDYNGNDLDGEPNNNWKIQSDIYNNPDFNFAPWRRVIDFEVAKSNDDYVYIVTTSEKQGNELYAGNLHLSTTGLSNNVYNPTSAPRKFLDISSNLPTVTYDGVTYNVAITGIAVSKTNHQKAWICVSGYDNTIARVYFTNNAGGTWIDADPNGCLPDLPANAIVTQDGAGDRLYLAMDNGVYVSEGTGANLSWKKLGDNFPNVMTMDLIIHECSDQLYARTYGRGIWSAPLLPRTSDYSAQEINSNTIWDENRIVEGNVLVKAGSKLTINNGATLYMPADAKIIVEQHAILEVDGATITNSCDNAWSGIVLEGDNWFNQQPLNHPIYQAKLELKNNAELSNVKQAITFGSGRNQAGGLVEAEDATISVTEQVAAFLSYSHHNYSYFRRCTFEYEAGLNSTPPSLITLWNNHGANFYGCTFRDETGLNLYAEDRGNGIYSIDATYNVTADCNMPNPISPCPSQHLVRGAFVNLNQGIYATGSAGQSTTTIDEIDFIDNAMACRVEGLDNVRFTRNTVLSGGVIKQGYVGTLGPNGVFAEQRGFYSNDATGFEVEQNTFEERSNAIEHLIGVNITNSRANDNEVYNNIFKNNEVGQRFDQLNRNPLSLQTFTGLITWCNDNIDDNRKDIRVTGRDPLFDPAGANDGIKNTQSSPNLESAANLFSVTTQGHIENASAQNILYYHSGPGTREEPSNFTTGLVLPLNFVQATTCVNRFFPQPHGVLVPTEVRNNYYGNLVQYEQLLVTYHQLVDGGNTDSLIAAIDLHVPGEAQELRDQLMTEAPYLSYEALKDAASSGILTDALLLEVCLANPDATRSETFLDYVQYEIPNPLPANMVQLIYQNWETETPRTLLENQLGGLSAELGRASSQMLHVYALDSIDRKDSMESLLNSRKTLSALYQLAELEAQYGNYTTAINQLNAIANTVELNESQLTEHNNLKTLLTFKSNLAAQGIDYMELTEPQLDELRTLAETYSGRSATYAQNILCFGYGECDWGQAAPQGRKKAPRVYNMTVQTEQLLGKVQLQPNPANEQVNLLLEAELIEQYVALQVVFINAEGKNIHHQWIMGTTTAIEVASWAKGIYTYQVVNEKEVVASGQLIKN